jgi:hypothetical protein
MRSEERTEGAEGDQKVEVEAQGDSRVDCA